MKNNSCSLLVWLRKMESKHVASPQSEAEYGNRSVYAEILLSPVLNLTFILPPMKLTLRLIACLAASQMFGFAQTSRPNIVWLTSEDNSIHYMDLYREGGAATPNIAKLAEHGLVFENAFSNAPVCSVARTTLLTGAYGPRIGAQYHRHAKRVPMPEGGRMYPWYLQQVGYYTTNNSKTDYNAIVSGGWDESSNKATWRNRKPGQPFFHVQNTTLTHESSLHFSAEEMATVENETPSDSVTPFPYHPDTPTFRYTQARYHDRHKQMDAYHGDYIRMLEEDGVLDDTFIFYYGDHGPSWFMYPKIGNTWSTPSWGAV